MPHDIADALGSKPIAVRTFEVQAAFAMTFNKLQGATMESLVVVMTELKGLMMGSHTAAKAGVAFTRVKHSRTLGIFPCEDGELDHLLKLQHPGWLRAWARNYDDDGYWLRDRLPIDPVALTTYRDWKHANPNNPTSGVGVTDLKRVTTAAGLSTRLKAPCGSKTKTGFESRPMRRAELVAQLARLYPNSRRNSCVRCLHKQRLRLHVSRRGISGPSRRTRTSALQQLRNCPHRTGPKQNAVQRL